MEHYVIRGGRRLEGAIRVHGAKNSVLPILAACVCCRGTCEIRNCPRISDVEMAAAILERLGCRVTRDGATLTVNAAELTGCVIPSELTRAMRSSVLFLGALLTRCGEAELAEPGGCALGARPIDLHLWAMERLGAVREPQAERLTCRWSRPQGAVLEFRYPSVGATENALLAAVGIPGKTVLRGAAREPEIGDLVRFLQAMGAEIQGEGTRELVIQGGRPFHGASFAVMPDRMEAATFLCAAAGCGGDIVLKGARRESLEAVLSFLERTGCQIESASDGLRLRSNGRLCSPGNVVTAPYPGFPTDAQAPAMAAVLRAEGCTGFTETVFENRLRHVEQFRLLGAEIQTGGGCAVVRGVPQLTGASLTGTDLRCGAALTAAALQAPDESRVFGISHIRRGYEDFDGCLRSLGADIAMYI